MIPQLSNAVVLLLTKLGTLLKFAVLLDLGSKGVPLTNRGLSQCGTL